jgi:glutathione S-transferase
MIAFEKFLQDNPDIAEKPYGDAIAASLSPGVSLPSPMIKWDRRRRDARHLPRRPRRPQATRSRFTDEANRLYGVLNNRLYDRRYLAGDEYTIADMICYPWSVNWKGQGQDKARARPSSAVWRSPPARRRTPRACPRRNESGA